MYLKANMNPVDHQDRFKAGACHSAQWFRETAQKMVHRGASGQEISDGLGTLIHVLLDWRDGEVELPQGNPWEWRQADLADFIDRRRKEW